MSPWDEMHQYELADLQRRAQAGTLTAAEQQRLRALLAMVDQEEQVALQPGLMRLREDKQQLQMEQARLQAQNATLAALAAKYEALVARARAELVSLQHERESLRSEYERVLR